MKKRFIVMVAALMLLLGIARAEGEIAPGSNIDTGQDSAFASLAELNGKRIDIPTGSSFDLDVMERLSDAELFYYNSQTDLLAALSSDKIGAFPSDEPVIRYIMTQRPDITYVPEFIDSFEFAYCFPMTEEGEALRDQFSEFLVKMREDGTLDAISEKWFSSDESAKTLPDLEALPAPNGTLTMATDGDYVPFEYVRDGAVVGYDVDVAAQFCQAYGYGLTLEIMNLDAVLPAVQTGKCDFAGSAITITPERAESVLFSEPNYAGGTELAGFDIELARRFAAWLGAELRFKVYDYGAIIPACATGDVDCVMADLNITPESVEALPFSDVLYEEKLGVMVRGDGDAAPGPRPESAEASEGKPAYAAFNGKRIGVVTGAIQGPAIEREIPEAELRYFNSVPDLLVAARAGKIDAFSATDTIIRYLMLENDDLTYLDEPLTETMDTGAIFPKTEAGAKLRSEFNAYLAEARDAGILHEIEELWLSGDESKKTVPDISSLSGENGALVLATDASMVPYSYIKDNTNVGMDIDNVLRFCQSRGYALKIVNMSFGALVDAVVAGKCDFAVGAIAYTKERAESVDFSDPAFQSYSVIAYLKNRSEPAVEDGGFWRSILNSFNKTFIREERWRLFVEGVLTTLLITLLAILFGTLLGFGVFMRCRNGNPAANLVTRFCLWLVQGMPMVVLLMILYYIIFGSVAISGILVAVIGFTLTFGAAVFGLLKMGVGAVENGQYEAAYALGYSNRRTFYKIILPQALLHVLPAYKGEIVGLIKATAIVGYIAVQDLTKMGDIVRSRTYEAFFPLIAVTIIYFLLEGLIGFLISRITFRFNPKRRKASDILKGVKTDDPN